MASAKRDHGGFDLEVHCLVNDGIPGVEIQQDVFYTEQKNPHQTLDLMVPTAAPIHLKPLLVFVHGGCWHFGDKKDGWLLAALFARRGFAVASVNYRLSSPLLTKGTDQDTALLSPEHTLDVVAALRWLAEQKDCRYDASKLILVAHTTGAHMIASCALEHRRLATSDLASHFLGVACLQGLFDLPAVPQSSHLHDLILHAHPQDRAEWMAPLACLPKTVEATGAVLQGAQLHKKTDHPISWLLLHALREDSVSKEQSIQFSAALRRGGFGAAVYTFDSEDLMQRVGVVPDDEAASVLTQWVDTLTLRLQKPLEEPKPIRKPEEVKEESVAGPRRPIAALIIGMAGSGKTTLVQRLNAHLHEHRLPGYLMNLDPAVSSLPYNPNIDIRDSVNYKAVMSEFNLGPNGSIMTALNLFATQFNQVVEFAEKRKNDVQYVLIDTPGQIEVFTWSASGSIIVDSMASTFPSVIVYVVDTPRCRSPITFVSNMLYACSIMYKTRLPLVVAFNKTDVVKHDFAVNWMQDFDLLTEALKSDSTYMGAFSRSMGLVLEEFYSHLQSCGVSAVTGAGIGGFFEALDRAAVEYQQVYVPLVRERMAKRKALEEAKKKESLDKLKRDLKAEEKSSEE